MTITRRSRQPARMVHTEETRRLLALVALAMLAASAAAALWVPGGAAVFEKLLPILSLVLGHFFPQR